MIAYIAGFFFGGGREEEGKGRGEGEWRERDKVWNQNNYCMDQKLKVKSNVSSIGPSSEMFLSDEGPLPKTLVSKLHAVTSSVIYYTVHTHGKM